VLDGDRAGVEEDEDDDEPVGDKFLNAEGRLWQMRTLLCLLDALWAS